MKAVPRRLLVLGGGRAGVELAQVVRRFGGEVALVETAERVLAREQAPLGEALGEALCRDGIELFLRVQATAARRDGQDYFLELDDGRELRGDRLPVAAGRRPRVAGIGLETVGIEAAGDGIPVDPHLRAGGVQDATYTHAYAESSGFLTLLSDGKPLSGAYALGPEAGEWLQQATMALRAHVPLEVLRDTVQPFPAVAQRRT